MGKWDVCGEVHSAGNEIGDWHDYVSLVLSGLGVASEFSGLGELYDGSVGLVVASGSIAWDIYDASRKFKE